jgi:hypothetical protein
MKLTKKQIESIANGDDHFLWQGAAKLKSNVNVKKTLQHLKFDHKKYFELDTSEGEDNLGANDIDSFYSEQFVYELLQVMGDLAFDVVELRKKAEKYDKIKKNWDSFRYKCGL